MWTSHRIEREKFDVRLFCRADGQPQPTVTWLDRNDVALKNNSKQHQVHHTYLSHTYFTLGIFMTNRETNGR